jgi:hypothetical protein
MSDGRFRLDEVCQRCIALGALIGRSALPAADEYGAASRHERALVRHDPVMVSIDPEGGELLVKVGPDGVEITGDAPGLRDFAKWCLALAAGDAPLDAHAHFDAGISPLHDASLPLLLRRDDSIAN